MSRTFTARSSAACLAACLAAVLIAACEGDGGGSSDTSGATTEPEPRPGPGPGPGTDVDPPTGGETGDPGSGGTTGAGDGSGTTAGGDTGSDTGGGLPAPDGAGLSHEATLLPRNDVDPAGLVPPVSSAGRTRAAALPDPLGVIYEVTENHGGDTDVNCGEVGAEYSSCSTVNLHLKDANGALNDGDWRLFFHSLQRVLRVDSESFDVFHVNGDLYYLAPAEGFTGVGDDGTASIRFVNEFSQLIESDFLPRYWLVRDGAEPQLLPNTDEVDDERRYAMPISGENRNAYNGEPPVIRTPAQRFARNADIATRAAGLDDRAVQSRIVPAPREIAVGAASVSIAGGFSFAGTDLSAASVAALEARQSTLGVSPAAGLPLTATLDAGLAPGTHTLDVEPGGIRIVGHDEEALFNGAQSLLALVRIGVPTVPAVAIVDGPRFAYRGMHIDVARNFQSTRSILKLIDQMAAYKLNRLHLHLSDDEGWRLEIPGLPELTGVGARRAFALDAEGRVNEATSLMPQLGSGPSDDTSGSGHFTRDEFVALLRHADARHVQIIPEFDMPAHARAAVVAMRARAVNLGRPTDTNVRIDDPDDSSRYVTIQHYDDNILNPCVPGTYAFVGTVIEEVAAMYAEAGAPLDIWHMGGDEAGNIYRGNGYPNSDPDFWHLPWERSPACTAYIAETDGVDSREDLERHFVERVSRLVADAGIPRIYLWHEIVDGVEASELATEAAGVTFWRQVSSGQSTVEAAHDFAARGFETVISAPDFLYLSFAPEADPEERGKYWAARSTGTRKLFGFAPENLPQNAETSRNRNSQPWSGSGSGPYPGYVGMQGHLWSELIRTEGHFDYAVYPRLLALAERAWHRADWELDYAPGTTYSEETNLVDDAALAADYALFAAALARKELAKLDAANVAYRIPVPGASSTGGSLEMNVELPGLPLEYTLDGQTFTRWATGAPPSATAVRARSADGARAGRADAVE